MAWTYDPAKIEVGLNWVRLRIGDTDTNDQQLSDEEITSLLAVGDRVSAAVAAARAISAKYARYGAQQESEVFAHLASLISQELEVPYL